MESEGASTRTATSSGSVGCARASSVNCRNGRYRDRTLGTNGSLGIEFLAVPEFYAEIAFEYANAQDVVRPYFLAMHYPASIIDPGSTKPRMLTVSLEFSSAVIAEKDPLKAASVSMMLPSVTPRAPIGRAELAHVITGWATVPSKSTVPLPTLDPGQSARYVPVSIKANFNEVGDPSKFLQAFAKAFAGSTGDYAKSITAEISPVGQELAGQDKDKKEADYYTALAVAQKSRADLLNACANNPVTPTAKASVESLFSGAVANQRKANLAADLASMPRPFATPDTVAGSSSSC